MPEISVLITCYNRQNTISDAIISVLSSSFQDYELIIVDDNSTDNSYSKAKYFESIDSRVKVFKNNVNLGDYMNRNKAFSYSKGEYIKYLDSDDIMYSHTLELMYRAMQNYPNAAYGFSYYGIQDNTCKFPYEISSKESYRKHFLNGGFFYAGPGGAIIRRKCFVEVSKFSGERYIGDVDLWMKLSSKYSCVVFWPGLIWWRIHDNQENIFEKSEVKIISLRHRLNFKHLELNNKYFTKSEYCLINLNFNLLYCRKVIMELLHLRISNSIQLITTASIPIQFYLLSFFPINRIFKKIMNIK